mgnify:CR=1
MMQKRGLLMPNYIGVPLEMPFTKLSLLALIPFQIMATAYTKHKLYQYAIMHIHIIEYYNLKSIY